MDEITFGVHTKEIDDTHSSLFIAEKGVYIVVEITSPTAHDDSRALANSIRDQLSYLILESADDVRRFMHDQTSTYHNEELSYAACCISPGKKVMVTTKNASVFLIREFSVYSIQQETGTTEGSVNPYDILLLATTSALPAITTHSDRFLKIKEPKEVDEIMNAYEYGGALLAIRLSADTTKKPMLTPTIENSKPILIPWRKIAIAIGILLLITLLVVGSVFLFNKIKAEQDKKTALAIATLRTEIQDVKNTISQDPKKALEKANEIEKRLAALNKSSLSGTNANTAKSLQKELSDLQKSGGDVAVTKDTLFFDMLLIDKNAQAGALSVVGSNIIISDNALKKVYVIDSTSKSFETYKTDGLNPSFISGTSKKAALIDLGKGLYLSNEKGTFDKKTNKQSEWKKPVELVSYGSNLYLLDPSANNVFKYTPLNESAYSNSILYFPPGSSVDLSRAKSIAVDFYVYILTSGGISKFKAASEEPFEKNNTTNYTSLSGIATSEESENLYALDAVNGRIIVFDKKGGVVTSIFNQKLKDTKFFGVVKDSKIFFLHKNAVYTLDI